MQAQYLKGPQGEQVLERALKEQRIVLLSVRLQSFRFLLLPKICQGRRQGPQEVERALKWPLERALEEPQVQVAEQVQVPQGPQEVRKPLEPQEPLLAQEVAEPPLGASSWATTNLRCLHAPGQAFPCILT